MAKRFRSPIEYRLRKVPVKQIVVWKDAQARKLDRDGVAELAKSIRAEGLQNPPLVQREGRGRYKLMAGQRRLAALKRLRAKTVPVLVITRATEYGIEDAKAASVIENLHRKGMSQRDLAASCVFLAEKMGTQARAARTLGMSVPTFKKLHGFAGVPERLKDLVPGTISRDEATRLHVAVPSTSRAVEIAMRISKHAPPVRRQYVRILSENPRMQHAAILKRARKIRTQQKVPVVLSKRQAAFLERQSEKRGMEQDELAKKIVSDWIRRRI